MLSQGTGNIAKGQTDVERGAGLTWVARMSRFMTAVAESQSDIVGFLHNVAGSLIIQDMAHILITENRFLDEYTSQLRLGCVEKILDKVLFHIHILVVKFTQILLINISPGPHQRKLKKSGHGRGDDKFPDSVMPGVHQQRFFTEVIEYLLRFCLGGIPDMRRFL